MPSVNLRISQQGPLLDAKIGVSATRREAMQQAGEDVPEWVCVRLLIDTGTHFTCLDPWIIERLKLSPSGTVDIHTPSTDAQHAYNCQQYDISLMIPHPNINRIFGAVCAIESHLRHQGIDGLLGRDLLSQCLFIYNGELNTYTLSF